MLLVGAGVLVLQEQGRVVEGWLAAFPIRWWIADYSSSYGPHTFFPLDDGTMVSLGITLQCSAVLLIAPLAGLTGLIILSMRGKVWRILSAFFVSTLVDVAANQARIAALAFAYLYWGKAGFDQVHFLYGGVFALFMFGLSFALYLWIALIAGIRRTAAPTNERVAP